MVSVSYNRACLNCQVESGQRHVSTFADREFMFDTPKATWEMRGVWKIKKTLANANIPCDLCLKTGCFDVWDVIVDDIPLYSKPLPTQPWTKLFIEKIQGELEISAESIVLSSNIVVLTFFDLISQVIKDMPDFPFIEHKNGFLTASVYYILEKDEATFNKLRHSGLSKADILFGMKNSKRHSNIKLVFPINQYARVSLWLEPGKI